MKKNSGNVNKMFNITLTNRYYYVTELFWKIFYRFKFLSTTGLLHINKSNQVPIKIIIYTEKKWRPCVHGNFDFFDFFYQIYMVNLPCIHGEI